MPILLSGDTHHYSRYYAAGTGTHFITSGGGGAFLHPTHHLNDSIEIRWLNQRATLSLLTDPQASHAPTDKPACYPTREESRRLLNGDMLFWKQNAGFSFLLGIIYWIFAMALVARHHLDAYIIVFMFLTGGMVAYFGYQEGFKRLKIWVAAILHATAHYGAIVALTLLFEQINTDKFGLEGIWPWFFSLGFEIVPTGLIAGGVIFGLFLMITCRWFDMNHNDAFSAMRLDRYRHFLRLRIKDDEVTIFPIGLDKVPRRDEWRVNPNWTGDLATEPAYFAEHEVQPRLIERPIVVRAT